MTSCAAAISHGDRRLAAKPEVAIHMAKTQLRGLARQEGLGDTTETDGDLLTAASSGGAALRCPAAGGRWDPARASRGP